MKSSSNKILLVIPGLKIDLQEGAKHRIMSFAQLYRQAGYQVTGVIAFPVTNFFHVLNWKKYLPQDIHWIFVPSFSLFKYRIASYITSILLQIVIGSLTHLQKYRLIQAEFSTGGAFCCWKPAFTPLLVDFHGDLQDEMLYKNPKLSLYSWQIKRVRTFTRKSLQKADLCILVSAKMQKIFEEQTGKRMKKAFIFPCLSDLKRFKCRQNIDLQKQLQNRIAVGYIGGLQKWQNIDIILDLVCRLRKLDSKIFLCIFTNFSTDFLQHKLAEIGEDNYLIRALSSEEVPEYLSCLDASFLIRENRPLNLVSSPTKISESLAAGVPIIATQFSGDIAELVRHSENGYILPDIVISDQELLVLYAYLCNLSKHRELAAILCKNSIKNRTWEIYSKNLLKIIQSY